MTNREKVDYINIRLRMDDLLLALAEETAEAGQAALKLHRALDGRNPTPVLPDEAFRHLTEEIEDALLCWNVLLQRLTNDNNSIYWEYSLTNLQERKLDRWAKRLMEAKRP